MVQETISSDGLRLFKYVLLDPFVLGSIFGGLFFTLLLLSLFFGYKTVRKYVRLFLIKIGMLRREVHSVHSELNGMSCRLGSIDRGVSRLYEQARESRSENNTHMKECGHPITLGRPRSRSYSGSDDSEYRVFEGQSIQLKNHVTRPIVPTIVGTGRIITVQPQTSLPPGALPSRHSTSPQSNEPKEEKALDREEREEKKRIERGFFYRLATDPTTSAVVTGVVKAMANAMMNAYANRQTRDSMNSALSELSSSRDSPLNPSRQEPRPVLSNLRKVQPVDCASRDQIAGPSSATLNQNINIQTTNDRVDPELSKDDVIESMKKEIDELKAILIKKRKPKQSTVESPKPSPQVNQEISSLPKPQVDEKSTCSHATVPVPVSDSVSSPVSPSSSNV